MLDLADRATSRVANRPLKVRAKVSPNAMLRGEVEVLVVEVRALTVASLLVDRLVVRAEHVRVSPSVPPRLKAGPVGFKAVVTQDNVDTWVHASHLPMRLQLTERGVLARAGVAGFRMGEIETELTAVGQWLQLQPRRATFVGMPAPMVRFLRGYLPLPPLPAGARLNRVRSLDGELEVYFDIDDIDEPITPTMARRLRRRFLVPTTFQRR